MTIPFTQYITPNGRKRKGGFDRPEDIEAKAVEIIKEGFVFESEITGGGMVSLTISDPKKDEDVAIKLCANGPDVPKAVDEMINKFHATFLNGDKR